MTDAETEEPKTMKMKNLQNMHDFHLCVAGADNIPCLVHLEAFSIS
jgi:hypothetical protein